MLEVSALGLTGDHNYDGTVDAADYVAWRNNNINGQQGYDDWLANFGRMVAAVGASAAPAHSAYTAVPEPACSLLLLLLSAMLACLHRQRGIAMRRGVLAPRLACRSAPQYRNRFHEYCLSAHWSS